MRAFASDRTVKTGLEAFLGFFYPAVCQICRAERATAGEGYVGRRCWQQVQFIKPPFCERCGLPYEGELTTPFECANCREVPLHFRKARSAVAASGPVREVLHRYKYQHAVWFEPFLAELLVRAAVPELDREGADMIVPVPLHPAREREREFNQAARLAQRLSAATGIPVQRRLLRRIVPTHTQALLSREQRAVNVQGAFAVRRGWKLHGERIVLVDDVFTTGATTNACARALCKAGAGEVCVWTVARGL